MGPMMARTPAAGLPRPSSRSARVPGGTGVGEERIGALRPGPRRPRRGGRDGGAGPEGRRGEPARTPAPGIPRCFSPPLLRFPENRRRRGADRGSPARAAPTSTGRTRWRRRAEGGGGNPHGSPRPGFRGLPRAPLGFPGEPASAKSGSALSGPGRADLDRADGTAAPGRGEAGEPARTPAAGLLRRSSRSAPVRGEPVSAKSGSALSGPGRADLDGASGTAAPGRAEAGEPDGAPGGPEGSREAREVAGGPRGTGARRGTPAAGRGAARRRGRSPAGRAEGRGARRVSFSVMEFLPSAAGRPLRSGRAGLRDGGRDGGGDDGRDGGRGRSRSGRAGGTRGPAAGSPAGPRESASGPEGTLPGAAGRVTRPRRRGPDGA